MVNKRADASPLNGGYVHAKYLLYAQKSTQNNLYTKFCFVRVIVRSAKVSSSAKLLNLQPSKNGEEYRHRDENEFVSNIAAIRAKLLGNRGDILC